MHHRVVLMSCSRNSYPQLLFNLQTDIRLRAASRMTEQADTYRVSAYLSIGHPLSYSFTRWPVFRSAIITANTLDVGMYNEAVGSMCRLEIIIVFVSHYFRYTNISKSYQFELSDFLFCCYIDWINVIACAYA